MQEADGRRIARRQHRRLGHAVEAGRRRREAAVRQVGGSPGGRVVVAPGPAHAVVAGQQAVVLTHPHALQPAQLLDGAAQRRLLAEAQLEHGAHHLEARRLVQGSARLIKQAVGPRAARLAGGIEPDPGLPHPDDEAADAGRQRDCGVGDGDARFQQQAGQPADRDLRPHSGLVHQHEGGVAHIHLAVLQEDQSRSLFDRQRAQRQVVGLAAHGAPVRSQGRCRRHGMAQTRRISSRPKP